MKYLRAFKEIVKYVNYLKQLKQIQINNMKKFKNQHNRIIQRNY